jgi:hypothetical protein
MLLGALFSLQKMTSIGHIKNINDAKISLKVDLFYDVYMIDKLINYIHIGSINNNN